MSEAKTTAAIHDLGYKRYLGTRRPQSTRWLVILKNVVGMAWRGWWRTKVWVMGAGTTTIVIGAMMYFWLEKVAPLISPAGLNVNWADALLPLSFDYYTKGAFILSLTVAAPMIAKDLKAGAFEFYFSRPVRPFDYAAGKVGGVAVLMALLLIAGPMLLALFRLGLSKSLDDVVSNLMIVPKMVLVGVMATAVYSILPLAFSTFSTRSRNAMAAWAAFYLIFGYTAQFLAKGIGIPALGALDPQASVFGLAMGLFDIHIPLAALATPPMWACAVAIVSYCGLGLAIILWRVSSAERSGLGGG